MNGGTDFSGMYIGELKQWMADNGCPAYRARQLFDWLHVKRVRDFSLMTNLGRGLTAKLSEQGFVTSVTIAAKQVSRDGTVKYLFALEDGNCIESVAMFYKHGMSVCLSSQVGCRMGCKFCSSAKGGLVRSLTAAEILAQFYAVCDDQNTRAHSLVLMGTGEPLDNFDNVLRFYNLVTAPEGFNLGKRRVSLSTCGLADKIDALAALDLDLTLSVSLHAADNATRGSIMPVNNAYPIERLLAACCNYYEKTGRRISFEYAVIDNVNDGEAQAEKLAVLLRGLHAHVNLIPVNSGGAFTHTASDSAKIMCKKLNSLGQTATVRRTLGADIDAACGQLRNKYMEKERV